MEWIKMWYFEPFLVRCASDGNRKRMREMEIKVRGHGKIR